MKRYVLPLYRFFESYQGFQVRRLRSHFSERLSQTMSTPPLEAGLLDLITSLSHPGAEPDEARFNTTALELARYQREHNAAYGQFCEATGQTAPAHWREIAAVPTEAFRHAPLRTFPEEEIAASYHTSGTTGEGYGVHDFRTLELYRASVLGAWRALELPTLPQLILIRPPEEAPHSSLSSMMGILGKVAGQAWYLESDGKLKAAALLPALRAARKPVLLLGTALVFLHLFEAMGEESLSLPEGSRALETGGYKGSGRTLSKEALYGLFTEKLGLGPQALINEYSMTELSSQWYTRGMGQPHIGPAWTRSLVVNPATGQEVGEGEEGVVRLFDLANAGSVLAIQTRDLAIRRGAGFELIGRDPAALPRGCSRAADEEALQGA